ncbi:MULTISPECIES: iron-containing redox enzyme family protein [unclassified Herbaspirillum]|uniref:iron-containing redox enzyme family protein n=1 Tax=unclassified Herbaspirillum TaxID=2624150 RepID=UPI001E42896A|nr:MULTISPECIES: iron-containing redox enzyme family protein [unclassified Herbaspirillum]
MRSTVEEMQAAESAALAYRPLPDELLPSRLHGKLLAPAPDADALALARAYLEQQLQETQALACDLPEDAHALAGWMEQRAAAVGQAYATYLQERQAGAPRRFFTGKAHALNFLRRVAPTKLVDGAWLYSALARWRDPLFRPLILTYLEELGDGDPAMNHVSLYRSLLASHGGEPALPLSEPHYVQGAIQLALAYHGGQYEAEMFGFNLGYEQLPLHLLITAYELNELGIDPYYFTLHVTIDNAASGHARKAADAVALAAAHADDPKQFMRGVRRGYLLNDLGLSTMDVINTFDLDQEVVRLMQEKAQFGRMMHSDYCRIGGKTVNQWLEQPDGMVRFLQELVRAKWIMRAAPVSESRFWRLIDAPGGQMFGVFDDYEKQLIREWIEAEWSEGKRQPSYRALARARERPAHTPPTAPVGAAHELDGLREELSPGRHHFVPGLQATRRFSALYRLSCVA